MNNRKIILFLILISVGITFAYYFSNTSDVDEKNLSHVLVVDRKFGVYEQMVPWSKDLYLTWDYFKTIPEDPKSGAYTYTWINHTRTLNITNGRGLEFSFKSINVTAYFRDSISWVIEEQKYRQDSNEILKHEQGHFDIAEEYARKIENDMKNKLIGKTFSCGQKNTSIPKDCEANADKMLDEISNSVLSEWHDDEDNHYDPETNHGLNYSAQKVWNDRFAKLRD